MVLRRLVPGGMRPPPDSLEAAAPSGTCPLPNDFVVTTLGC